VQENLSADRKQYLHMKKQINGIFETKKSLEAVLGITKILQKSKDKNL
jgi:hypothetical protein